MTAVEQSAALRVHRIGIRVPDRRLAADHVAAVVGAGRVRHAATTTLVDADPAVALELIDADPPGPRDAPRVVDLGTQHVSWRVTDIDAAAEHLARQPDVRVLGDVVEIPAGPLAGNRWIYYRSPWGTLFELQQWPSEPAYTAGADVRLDHTRHAVAGAVLPAYAGVDHVGYSVADIDATVDYLVTNHDAGVALRADLEAGRALMSAQFGLDVEGASRMAMLTVDGLNIELFEHHIEGKRSPRQAGEFGDHHLALRDKVADVAARIVDPTRAPR